MFRFTTNPLPDLPAHLLGSPLLVGVPEPARRGFLLGLAAVTSEGGTVLFEQGRPGDTLWIVVEGSVTLTRQSAAEEAIELDRAGPGDVFGEMAVISPAARGTTATTLEASEFLVLTRTRYRELIEARDPCAEALLRYLTRRICRRLRQADARIALLHDSRGGADAADLAHHLEVLRALGGSGV